MAKTRRNIRTRKGSKKHRVSSRVKYNMKGCSKKHKHYHGGSGCGSNGCPFGGLPYSAMNSIRGGSCNTCGGNISYGPVLGVTQIGGSCTTCASCSKTTGGGFYKPAAPLPPPFVGKAWGGEVAKWPGVDGVDSGRNFFADNRYRVDPQTMMKLGGSRKHRVSLAKGKRRRNGIKGGGAFQDIINLGRDLSYNFQSTYNSLNGYGAAVNPKPYIQPLNSNKSVI